MEHRVLLRWRPNYITSATTICAALVVTKSGVVRRDICRLQLRSLLQHLSWLHQHHRLRPLLPLRLQQWQQ